MSHVDQFESAFRSAIRPVYQPHEIELSCVLTISDLSTEDGSAFADANKVYLKSLLTTENKIRWEDLGKGSYDSTATLLEKVQGIKPSLIVTYRNLDTDDWQFQNSVGSRLDTLINQTGFPVLVVPHPKTSHSTDYRHTRNSNVIAITDHLTDDHTLIDFAAAFVDTPGSMVLAHLEDKNTFDRYLEAISRITTIDTDDAAEKIRDQLLKDPMAYIQSCRERLQSSRPQIEVRDIVEFADDISRFKSHIQAQSANLLVMRGIDHDQPGIHGIAQRLINEIRQIPVLVV